MKDHLVALVQDVADPKRRLGLVREYLQALVLESLQRAQAMIPLAFHGGTALRFLYRMPRFSEDLDFALERPEDGEYDLASYLRRVKRDLGDQGFQVRVKLSDAKVVHTAFVRIPGILHEVGLSPHRKQVLAVKVEVDTRPPAGAGLETSLVRRHITLHLQHHDRPSLLAGKLHAILARPAFKGRDLYDLAWYLADPSWPPPNLVMLNAALEQTGWTRPALDSRDWKRVVSSRLAEISLERALADVRPFVEREAELDALSRRGLEKLLEDRR